MRAVKDLRTGAVYRSMKEAFDSFPGGTYSAFNSAVEHQRPYLKEHCFVPSDREITLEEFLGDWSRYIEELQREKVTLMQEARRNARHKNVA